MTQRQRLIKILNLKRPTIYALILGLVARQASMQ